MHAQTVEGGKAAFVLLPPVPGALDSRRHSPPRSGAPLEETPCKVHRRKVARLGPFAHRVIASCWPQSPTSLMNSGSQQVTVQYTYIRANSHPRLSGRSTTRLRVAPASRQLLMGFDFGKMMEKMSDTRYARCRHILIEEKGEDAQARLEELKADIAGDLDKFSEVATNVSTCTSAVRRRGDTTGAGSTREFWECGTIGSAY